MSRDTYEPVSAGVTAKHPPGAVDLAVAAALAQKEISLRSRSPVRNGYPVEKSHHIDILQTIPVDPIPRSTTNGSTKSRKKRTNENEVHGKPYADRTTNGTSASAPLVKGDDRLLRDIDRALPGDPPLLRAQRKSQLSMRSEAGGGERSIRESGGVTRKRSQFFEDAFNARDGHASPATERVRSEALVLAELRTNVIVNDEFSVITELSSALAVRYRRPLQSIVVTLQHNACMCFGGSFEPAYVMTIFALPSEVQPSTNKRNAALIQRHMEEALGVASTRGFLKFEAVPEANLAYGGKTMAGYMEEAGRSSISEEQPNGTNGEDGSRGHRRQRASRKLSVKSFSSFRSPSPPPTDVGAVDAASIYMDEKATKSLPTAPTSPQPSTKSEIPPLPPLPDKYPNSIPPVPPLPPIPPMAQQLPSIAERSSKGSPRDKMGAVDAEKAGRVGERRNRTSAYSTYSAYGRVHGSQKAATVETEIMGPDQKNRRVKRTKSFVATLFGRS